MAHSDRQIQIIDKSVEIIATKGIQGLTIKNLSKEIGISEAAIYRHFESKTDILLAIIKKLDRMSSFIIDNLDDTISSLDKIEFLFLNIIKIFSKEPHHIAVVFSEVLFKNDEILKTTIVGIMSKKESIIEKIILNGQNAGEIRNDIDNKTLAMIVMGSLRYMIKLWDLTNNHENLLEKGQKIVDGLKLMLTA